MANRTLIMITTRARSLKKKHPRTPWTELTAKASRQLRSEGKIGKAAKTKKYKQTGTSDRKSDRKRSAKPPGKRKTYTETRKNRSDAPGSLTGLTLQQIYSAGKKKINTQLDSQYVKLHRAAGVRAKKKVRKKITELKSKLRKLD